MRALGYDVVMVAVDGIERVPGNDGAELVNRRDSLRKFALKWQDKNVVKMEGGW